MNGINKFEFSNIKVCWLSDLNGAYNFEHGIIEMCEDKLKDLNITFYSNDGCGFCQQTKSLMNNADPSLYNSMTKHIILIYSIICSILLYPIISHHALIRILIPIITALSSIKR